MKKLLTIIGICIVIIGLGFAIKPNNYIDDIAVEDIYINDMQLVNNTFYYEALNEKQKEYYRVIAKGIMELEEKIVIDVTTETNYDVFREDVASAIEAFLADHPEVFFVNDIYEISFTKWLSVKTLNLKLDYVSNERTEILQMEDKLKSQIEKIKIGAKEYVGRYAKEEFIHDYIASNVSYYEHESLQDIPAVKHTAYGALVEGSAVCDGITKAFQLALAENDIESIFVTGITEGVAHAWAKVKLDNDYYNVDVTSDKTLNSENTSLVIHSYFNVTDEEIEKTHMMDNKKILPVCNVDKYNYYVYNDYQISYMDNFEYRLGQIIQKQQDKPLIEVNIVGLSDVPDKLVTALYNLNFNNFKSRNITRIEYNKVNNNYIVVK